MWTVPPRMMQLLTGGMTQPPAAQPGGSGGRVCCIRFMALALARTSRPVPKAEESMIAVQKKGREGRRGRSVTTEQGF